MSCNHERQTAFGHRLSCPYFCPEGTLAERLSLTLYDADGSIAGVLTLRRVGAAARLNGQLSVWLQWMPC